MTWLQGEAPRPARLRSRGRSYARGLLHSSGPYARDLRLTDRDVMSWAGPGGSCGEGSVFRSTPSAITRTSSGGSPRPGSSRWGRTPRRDDHAGAPRPARVRATTCMATIPISNAPGQFYTVEARTPGGIRRQPPRRCGGAAPGRSGPRVRLQDRAQVVDVDNNGDPNDAAAMWTPGETFTDSANGITVTDQRADRHRLPGHDQARRGRQPGRVGPRCRPPAESSLRPTAANGLVFAIGGLNGSGTVLRKVEAYNPSTNAWTTKASLPARSAGRQRCRHNQRYPSTWPAARTPPGR